MATGRLIGILLVVLVSVRSSADSSTARAKELYGAGVTEYNLGHYDTALASFEQAYRLHHDPAFLFNIGQCQRQLRRYEDAERSYRAYLRETEDLSQAIRDEVQKLIAEMRASVERERAKAVAPPAAPSGEAMAIAPPTPPVSRMVSPDDERDGRTKEIAGIAVAAFGVAAIATGGGFYAVAKSANDTLNHPSDGTYSAAAEDRRNTFQSLDVVAFLAGSVAMAAGAMVGVLGWRQRHHLTVTPTVSSHVAGATLVVGF